MSYVVLARKWRPKKFPEMVGQEHVLRALENALDSGKVHHAFLFTGTRGVGKTTVARILAKSLNCEIGVSATPCGVCAACREIDAGRFVDLIEVDAASRTKVDDTRELLDNVQYAPTRGRYKVYLIDEVHMLSNHSFNALLKTLEEPPPHVKFLLATTDPQKLPVTVLSRCLQFSLKRLSVTLIVERLRFIAAAEALQHEPAAMVLLARAADGSLRDALSLLDQLIAFGGGALSEANARAMLGTIDRGHVGRILDALARQDGPGLIAEVKRLDQDAPDYDRALIELAAFLQRIAIVQIVPEAAHEDEEFDAGELARLAIALAAEDVQLYYQIALAGRRDLAMAPEPRAGFEMTLLRMLAFRPDAGDALQRSAVAAAAVAPDTLQRSAVAAAAVAPDTPQRSAVAAAAVAPASGATATVPAPALPGSTAVAAASGTPGTQGTPVTSMQSEHRPTPVTNMQSEHRPIPVTSMQPEHWPAVVDAAQLTGMVRQFALNCVPASFEAGLLKLRLDAGAETRRTQQIEDRLVQGLSKYWGREIRIAYEASGAVLASAARQRLLAAQDRVEIAAAAFGEDPAVKGLRERFGAEVDVGSIKPAQA